MGDNVTLHLCGTRGSLPISGDRFRLFGGATSCYILRCGKSAVVVDCGTGLYNAADILRDCNQISVLLTHLHYDHVLGLLDLSVFPKNADIKFFSCFEKWLGSGTLPALTQPPFWPVVHNFAQCINVNPFESVTLSGGFSADFLKSNHPNDAMLIAVRWSDTRVCFACDYEHGADSLDEWVSGCELLLYDGMFSPEDYDRSVSWGHSTWNEGCLLALRSNVKRLIISHHHPKYDDDKLCELERSAQAVFPHCEFARDGLIINF